MRASAYTAILLAACMQSRPVLAPSTGASLAMAAEGGVSLTASATEWAGEPEIYEYVVPFAVELRNQSDRDVRVRYEDFSLLGSNGFSTTALNPFQAQLGALDKGEREVRHAAYRYTPPARGTPSRSAAPGSAPPPRSGGSGGGRSRGYIGWGYPSWGLGWGYGWWGWGGFGPYGMYPAGPPGWWWGGYYAAAPLHSGPSATRFALPEGVLKRGGETRGYVFFQKPSQSTGPMTLQWSVKDTQAQPLTQLDVAFEYVVGD